MAIENDDEFDDETGYGATDGGMDGESYMPPPVSPIAPAAGSVIKSDVPPWEMFGQKPQQATPRRRSSFHPDLDKAIDDAVAMHGADRNYLRTTARIESGGDPKKQTGQYKGAFMLSDDEFRRYGGTGDIFDPFENAKAAALKAKTEAAAFEKRHGRQPLPNELYMTHQQGEGGFDSHTRNPEVPAWENMYRTAEGRQKGPAWAKQAVWGNVPDADKRRFGSVENVTSRDFMGLWDRRWQEKSAEDDDGPVHVAQAPRIIQSDVPPWEMFGRKGQSAPAGIGEPPPQKPKTKAEIKAEEDERRSVVADPSYEKLIQYGAQKEGVEAEIRQIRKEMAAAKPEDRQKYLLRLEEAGQRWKKASELETFARPSGMLDVLGGNLTPEEAKAELDSRMKEIPGQIADQERLVKDLEAFKAKKPNADMGEQAQTVLRELGRAVESKDVFDSVIEHHRQKLEELKTESKNFDEMAKGLRPGFKLSATRSGIENVLQGVSNTVTSIPKFAGYAAGYLGRPFGISDPETNSLVKAAEWAEDMAKIAYPGDPARQKDFSQKLSQGAGSMIGFMGVGKATQLLTGGSRVAGTTGTALTGGASQGAETVEEATGAMRGVRRLKDKDTGKTTLYTPEEKDRLLAAGWGFLFGTSEAIPISRAMKRPSGGELRQILGHGRVEMLEEGTQEFGQSVAGNIVARNYYDPTRDVFEGTGEATLIGGILGYKMGAAKATLDAWKGRHAEAKDEDEHQRIDKSLDTFFTGALARGEIEEKDIEGIRDKIKKERPEALSGFDATVSDWRRGSGVFQPTATDAQPDNLEQPGAVLAAARTGTPRTTPPPLPGEVEQQPAPQTKAPLPPTADEESVLKRMGYSITDIRDMEPDQRAAEMDDARARGIVPGARAPGAVPPPLPSRSQVADNPSAEPLQDILAQTKDLADPKNPRQGVYLSRANLEALGQDDAATQQVTDAWQTVKGEVIDNVDGNGGLLAVKSPAVAAEVRQRLAAGEDFQAVIGDLTGSGRGKSPDASAVVQQVTPEGAVTRESAVPQEHISSTIDAFKADGRSVRTLTPEQAIQRREQGLEPPPLPQVGDGSRGSPVRVQAPEDVARAGERVVEPTDGQRDAGNYSKGHIKFQGLDITIENPKGSTRSGVSPDGKFWEVTMPATYGYIKRSKGKDGDQVDVYVGDSVDAPTAFVIDQIEPGSKKLDEHKVMLGFPRRQAALDTYNQAFSDGSAQQRIGGITEMPMEDFKAWVARGKRSRPLSKLDWKPYTVADQPTETTAEQLDIIPDNLTDAERETLVKAWRYVNAIEQARAQGRDIQQARLDIANELDADLASYGITFDEFPDEQSLREHLGSVRGEDQKRNEGAEKARAAEDKASPAAGSGRPEGQKAEVVQRGQEDRGREGDGTRDGNAEVSRPSKYEGDPLSPDDVGTIVEQWKYLKDVASRPAPQSLTSYVIANGGIIDDKGEARHIAGSAKERPGLINKNGMRLDDIARSAWEAGFMGDRADRPSVADFLEVLQDDLHTGTVVRTVDEPLLDDINIANEIARELADYGVTIKRFRSEANLRKYFGQEGAEAVGEAQDDEAQDPAASKRQGQAGTAQDDAIEPPPFDGEIEAKPPTTRESFIEALMAGVEDRGNEVVAPNGTTYRIDFKPKIGTYVVVSKEADSGGVAFTKGPGGPQERWSRPYAAGIAADEAGLDDTTPAPTKTPAPYEMAKDKKAFEAYVKDGQTSLVPEPTIGEKIAAEAKKKANRGKDKAEADAGELFNPDAGKQTDLVEAVKAAKKENAAEPVDGVTATDAASDILAKFSLADLVAIEKKFQAAGFDRGLLPAGVKPMDLANEIATRRMRGENEKGAQQPATETKPEPKAVETREASPAEKLRDRLISEGFDTIVEARKFARDIGITGSNKQIDEAVEAAVVDAARDIVANGETPSGVYSALVDLYAKQPNLASRTGTSVANQAYSTPMPLAYLASRLAGVATADSVYEPTAGNGALLIEADPANAKVNELDPARAEALRKQGFTVTTNDGSIVPSFKNIDSVIMNPPFGAVKESGKSKEFTVGDWSTTAIDHAVALNGLEAMDDDGKAVLILGGVKATDIKERRKGYRGQAKREFYFRLYNQYNVVDHFTVDGDLYKKQGAGWPVDVVVIDGRGKSERALPAANPPMIFDSWESLAEKLPNDNDARTTDRPARDAVERVQKPDGRDAVGSEQVPGSGVERPTAGPEAKPARVRKTVDRGQSGDESQSAPAQSRDQEPGSNRDSGRVDQPVAARKPRVERKQPPAGSGQSNYEAASVKADSLDTLIPVNMADAAKSAMKRVADKHGSVDALVAGRLGYPEDAAGMFVPDADGKPKVEHGEIVRPFSAEQVDAIASAIDNAERGDAFIIGDQCVAGDTKIYDPVTATYTEIKALSDAGKPIKVLALTPVGFQVASATAPFRKGEADLYRVVMDDGREIKVTRQHRFLTPDGWRTLEDGLHVGCFLGSAEGRPLKNLVGRQSVQRVDGSHWSRKPQGYQDDCSSYPYPCDARLPSDQGSAQAPSPSPADVLGRIQLLWRMDDLGSSEEHNRPHQLIGRRSKNSSSPKESRDLSLTTSRSDASPSSASNPTRRNEQPFADDSVALHRPIAAIHQPEQAVDALDSYLSEYASVRQPSSDCSERYSRARRIENQCHGGLTRIDNRATSRLTNVAEMESYALSLEKHTGWRRIVSIEFVGRDEFFDMWVPGFENYMAEGLINHNTGIGKGRIAAGMLRYAMKQGLRPVFVTEKPDLYGDMFRDLRDIGVPEMLGREPGMFITNAGATIPLDEEALAWKQEADLARENGEKIPPKRGKFLSGGTSAKIDATMAKIAGGAEMGTNGLPDVIFTTYDQMNTVKGQDTDRRKFISRIAADSFVVLDESHNAGGAGQKGWEKKNATPDRATFVRDIAARAKGVMFSSATYAKRPDVMDLYARTDMGRAVDDPKRLPELIQRGGVPMQQIVASMLANSGQYLRRERSFEGVEYAVEGVPVNQKSYRQFSAAVRAIFKFDLAVQDARKEIMEDILDAKGMAMSKDSGVGESAAHTTAFAGIMHNVVNQMLLAIKAGQAAKRAIKATKDGEKPVIALANTNESFIKDFAEQENVSLGQALDMDFGEVLRRYLSRTLRVTIKHPDKTKEHVEIPVARLGAGLQRMYADALAEINDGSFDGMPISPIDWIRHEVTQAGLKVAEVTGRQTMIDYGASTPKYVARPKSEMGPAGKRGSIAAFNRGALDVLILNRSGSTGVSMHANKTFKDQRRRRMIIAQAEGNIDTHLQMLGRVHRTGQVVPPAYSQIAAEIPAEARPTAVLMKKMASLNANTTGARGSVFMADSVDFMNEIGDKVVADLLLEDSELDDELGGALKVDNDGIPVNEDAARRATGRLILLDPDKQSEFLERVQTKYKSEVEQLDALGENPLEAKTLDLQAKTVETTALKPKQGDSPFLDEVRIEKVSVKAQGRAMLPSDIAAKVAETLKVSRPDGAVADGLRNLEARGREAKDAKVRETLPRTRDWIKADVAELSPDAQVSTRKRHEEQMARWVSTMNVAYPGARVTLSMPAGDIDGIVMSVERTGKAKFPVALGSWESRIAVPDGAREYVFPFSKLFPSGTVKSEDEKGATIAPSSNSHATLVGQFEEARKEGRETRYMVTGNILGGYDQVAGKGRIVNYTTEDGEMRPGVFMGRDFDLQKFMGKRAVRFQSAEQVAKFLDKVPAAEVKDVDGNIVVRVRRGEFSIEMPASRQTGGRYYTDPAVRKGLGGKDFEKRGNKMIVQGLSRSEAVKTLDAIRNVGAIFETREAQDEAHGIVSSGSPLRSAGSMARNDAKMIENIRQFLRMGRSVNMPKDAVQSGLTDLRANLDLVPAGTPVGVLSRIEPNREKGAKFDAVAIITDTDGVEHRLPVSARNILETRAFTVTDGSLIGLVRFSPSSLPVSDVLGTPLNIGRGGVGIDGIQTSSDSRGLVAHEVIHVKRRLDRIAADVWSRLVGHAGNLRIIDKEFGTYLREIGHPDADKYPGGVTIGELYRNIYSRDPDIQERLDQESVAIMTELAVHGQLMPFELDPIRADLQAVFSGQSAAEAKGESPSGQSLFALDASIGQSMRRDLDALGFYSKALEAARGIQAKGTPEQMLAQLKKAGVKDAELEATGLDRLFKEKSGSTPALESDAITLPQNPQQQGDRTASPPRRASLNQITRDEIIKHLEGNRVGLKEVVRDLGGHQPISQLAAQFSAATTEAERDRLSALIAAAGTRSADPASSPTYSKQNPKWQNYSLDPANPTYRETVIHLPVDMPDAEAARSRVAELRASVTEPGISFDEMLSRRRAADAAAQEMSAASTQALRKRQSAFQSGHFPEPNIVGHMMTSMTRHEGRPVYTIDQIQSDWGQKLRDGGVRDEQKIAELESKVKEIAAKHNPALDAWKEFAMRLREGRDPVDWLPTMTDGDISGGMRKAENWFASNRVMLTQEQRADFQRLFLGLEYGRREVMLASAELQTLRASAPGHPLVNTTDQWTTTTLRRAIRQAVEAGADYIAVPSGDTVLRYNPGDENGMRHFYGTAGQFADRLIRDNDKLRFDKQWSDEYKNELRAAPAIEGIVPKNLRKILNAIDKSTGKPQVVDALETPSGMRGMGFTLFPLTEKIRQSVVEEGQPLFSFSGIRSQTANLGQLDRAKTMASDGHTRADIWFETGWFKHDGRWFEERDDRGFKRGASSGRLEQAAVHPTLFKDYPELANIPVNAMAEGGPAAGEYLPKRTGIAGLFDRLKGAEKQINITRSAAETTLLHEIQHAIDDIEGGFRNVDKKNPYGGAATANSANYVNAPFEQLARAAEARANMTTEERRARPPWLDFGAKKGKKAAPIEPKSVVPSWYVRDDGVEVLPERITLEAAIKATSGKPTLNNYDLAFIEALKADNGSGEFHRIVETLIYGGKSIAAREPDGPWGPWVEAVEAYRAKAQLIGHNGGPSTGSWENSPFVYSLNDPLDLSPSARKERADLAKELASAINIIQRIAGPAVELDLSSRFDPASIGVNPDQIKASKAAGLRTATAGGYYNRPGLLNGRAMIGLALNDPNYDIRTVAGHEAFHHVEEVLASEAEKRIIRSATEMGRMQVLAAAEIGMNVNDPALARLPAKEIRAIAFQRYRRMMEEGADGASRLHIASRRFFARLARIMASVRNLLAGRGYDSYESIFERARTGEMVKSAAARDIDEAAKDQSVRSLRGVVDPQMRPTNYVEREPFDLNNVRVVGRYQSRVPIDDIYTSQRSISVAAAKAKLRDGSTDDGSQISLFKFDGRYYLNDGNHRVEAARAFKMPSVNAEVIELAPRGTHDDADVLEDSGSVDVSSELVGAEEDRQGAQASLIPSKAERKLDADLQKYEAERDRLVNLGLSKNEIDRRLSAFWDKISKDSTAVASNIGSIENIRGDVSADQSSMDYVADVASADVLADRSAVTGRKRATGPISDPINWTRELTAELISLYNANLPLRVIGERLSEVSGQKIDKAAINNKFVRDRLPRRQRTAADQARSMIVALAEQGMTAGDIVNAVVSGSNIQVTEAYVDRIITDRRRASQVSTSSAWPADALAILRQGVADGKTYQEIADDLQVATGNVYSRSAVAGRISRGRFGPGADSDVQASLIPTAAKVYSQRWIDRMRPSVDRIRIALQDKVLPIRRQEEAIESSQGVKLPDQLSVYMAEAIYHGRAGERLNDFQQDAVDPLIEHLRANSISIDDFGDYLYARHAIERNAAISQIDPANLSGSGMTDSEATSVLNKFGNGKNGQAFVDAVAMVDKMVSDARDTLYRSGLLTKEQYDNWRTKYQYYVPLRGFEGEENDSLPKVGRGMDVRGPESMQALGRRSKADNPLVYVLQQSVQAVIRSEKNRVDKTLYRLIQAHPDPDVWKVFKGEARRRINPSTGLVETNWVPPAFAARNNENVFGVKIAGKQHYMEILHEPLARSLRAQGPGVLGTIPGRALYSASRFYAQLVTSYNPEFVISNYLRDIQTALMNVGDIANKPADLRKKIISEAMSMKAIRGVMAALQSHEGKTIFGQTRAADENMLGRKRSQAAMDYAKWFEEYRLAGGKISFIEINDVDRIKNRIAKSIKEGKTKRALRNVFDLIDNANSAVENGVRLSVYIALRQNGISQDRAAYIARELTVNFNRKGEYGPAINAAYLFFNASVQGTTRLAQAVSRSPAVRKGVAAIYLAGVLIDLMNYMVAADDDDGRNAYEKIPDWIKEKNMIFMLPGRKDYVQIPMPYGYNVFYLSGQKTAALSRTAAGFGNEKPTKALAGLMGAVMESFSPFGAAPTWTQMVTPTLLDPFVQIQENKTFFGGPIQPKKFNEHKPDSENFFSTAPAWAIDFARALNRISGGDRGKPGAIDVSPESIEHMVEFAGGGVAKFASNIWKTGERAYNGQEWLPEKTPFLRRLYGKATTESRRRDFFEKWNEVDGEHFRFDTLRRAQDREGMARVRAESPAEIAAWESMRAAQRQLGALKKQSDAINLQRDIDNPTREQRLKVITDRENEIILRALANYNRLKKEAKQKKDQAE